MALTPCAFIWRRRCWQPAIPRPGICKSATTGRGCSARSGSSPGCASCVAPGLTRSGAPRSDAPSGASSPNTRRCSTRSAAICRPATIRLPSSSRVCHWRFAALATSRKPISSAPSRRRRSCWRGCARHNVRRRSPPLNDGSALPLRRCRATSAIEPPHPESPVIARILAASVALTLAAGGAASACRGGTAPAALDDAFKNPDPGWGPPDAVATFTADGLVLKPPVNGSAWRSNPNYALDGSDLCVAVTNPRQLSGPGDIGDVGVRFWASSAQSFYTATLSLDGSVAVDRLVNGVWHGVVPPT